MSHPAPSLARRLLDVAVAGVVGDLVVRGAVAAAPRVAPVARDLVVATVARGIVVTRWLGQAAEDTRLRAGDVVAEARERLGEQVPPPGATPGATGDGHVH